jgi:hypothetical protein
VAAIYRRTGLLLGLGILMVLGNLFVVVEGRYQLTAWRVSDGYALIVVAVSARSLPPTPTWHLSAVSVTEALVTLVSLDAKAIMPTMSSPSLAGCILTVPLIGIPGFSALCYFVVATYRHRNRFLPERVCVVCEYDLRGNRSGRCPECGTHLNEVPRFRGGAHPGKVEPTVNQLNRRRALLIGLGPSALFLSIALVSCSYEMGFRALDWTIRAERGVLAITRQGLAGPPEAVRLGRQNDSRLPIAWLERVSSCRESTSESWLSWPRAQAVTREETFLVPGYVTLNRSAMRFTAPLWILVAIAAASTIAIWRFVRQKAASSRAGHGVVGHRCRPSFD